jgi:hypothetical protein
MGIKRKTCDIRKWKKKTFISQHILHRFTVHRNPQHISLLTVVSHFRPCVSTSSLSANFWQQGDFFSLPNS